MPSATQSTPDDLSDSQSSAAARLEALGLCLPDVVRPSHLFSPAVAHGGIVSTSGQVPVQGGELIAAGTVGSEIDIETARECARQCLLNAMAAIEEAIGDLDRIQTIIRMTVFVVSTPQFGAQGAIADAASELLANVFSKRGKHARVAAGVVALPRRAPVEIELTAAYTPRQ